MPQARLRQALEGRLKRAKQEAEHPGANAYVVALPLAMEDLLKAMKKP
jgi:hypothetical protein